MIFMTIKILDKTVIFNIYCTVMLVLCGVLSVDRIRLEKCLLVNTRVALPNFPRVLHGGSSSSGSQLGGRQ